VRVAALYDIHGNLPALEAVLADPRFETADTVVVGGDVVAGPVPAETPDRLEGLGTDVWFVRGNGDREVVGDHDAQSSWCRDQLGQERASRVAVWPLSFALEIESPGSVRFCHATPQSDEVTVTRVTPDALVEEAFATYEENVAVYPGAESAIGSLVVPPSADEATTLFESQRKSQQEVERGA
jgi:hypothetical protein